MGFRTEVRIAMRNFFQGYTLQKTWTVDPDYAGLKGEVFTLN
jgi:hypothetical protein